MSWLRRLGVVKDEARIAPVSLDDASRLSEIHAAAFARPWGPEEFEAFLLDRSIQVDGLFVGRSRQPSGFVISRIVLDEAEILSVALARSVRGRGHARPLLSRHLLTLEQAGVAKVHLEVEEGNEPALALYRRIGFVQSGLRPGYYARPDGTRATALSMTCVLSESAIGTRP